MEQEQTQQKKSKKPILFGLLMLLIGGVIGGTFAYFTSSDTFENEFKTKPYRMEVTETFSSPTDWTPGTTTNKTVIATNKGDVPAAVRVHYVEEWKDSGDNDLPLTQTVAGQPVRAAIINFASTLGTNWTTSTENGTTYYYYKTALAKDQATTSLIDSVQFNPNVPISTSDVCTYTLTDNTTTTTKPDDMSTVKSTTCTTSTSGYAGGTYKLTIYVETVQYDQYQAAWGTSVAISAPVQP